MGSFLGAPLVSQESWVMPTKDKCQPQHVYCYRAAKYTQEFAINVNLFNQAYLENRYTPEN